MPDTQVAVFDTNLGEIVVELYPDKAPKHVESFTKLIADGYYDGIKFHRVIPGFMIQAGCPHSKTGNRMLHGTGGPGYTVPAEFNDIPHTRGILSAARTSDPNSAGSQFFLMVAAAPHLDRQYSVFGKVVSGMDVVDKIVALPRDQRDNPLPANPAVIERAYIRQEGSEA